MKKRKRRWKIIQLRDIQIRKCDISNNHDNAQMEVKKALHYGWYRALWRLREMRDENLKVCWDS